VERGNRFASALVTDLGAVPTRDLFDRILATVRLTPDNLRNLVSLMDMVAQNISQTVTDPDGPAAPHDPELRALDAALSGATRSPTS
jgi:hypothetical protein